VFNGVLFGLGFLAVTVVVAALAVLPSWRAAQSGAATNNRDQPVSHTNPWSRWSRGRGRHRRPRGGSQRARSRRGRSSVPVATALVGATVAVVALVATTVFGASLTIS